MPDKKPSDFPEVIRIAATLWTDQELAIWLTAPQEQHENWTPLQMLGCGKIGELLQSLKCIEDGVYL